MHVHGAAPASALLLPLLLNSCSVPAAAFDGTAASFNLPEFSWDVVPRFVHCGPDSKPDQPGKPPRLSMDAIYKKMSEYPMAT